MINKLCRTITSILPIDKNRKGKCINCGECCKLPNKCIFLGINKNINKESYCKIYKLRPIQCRKYPRTNNEFITQNTCGYTFK